MSSIEVVAKIDMCYMTLVDIYPSHNCPTSVGESVGSLDALLSHQFYADGPE